MSLTALTATSIDVLQNEEPRRERRAGLWARSATDKAQPAIRGLVPGRGESPTGCCASETLRRRRQERLLRRAERAVAEAGAERHCYGVGHAGKAGGIARLDLVAQRRALAAAERRLPCRRHVGVAANLLDPDGSEAGLAQLALDPGLVGVAAGRAREEARRVARKQAGECFLDDVHERIGLDAVPDRQDQAAGRAQHAPRLAM